ncbi:very short patch repair endonuclease [Sphingopyxis sp.]|uniref:very short patch repair endonuclease n=1 Tax=Sphingopyxis sp. TaxID=1908224 RepID=UPI00262D6FE1|nr:very short patch repair endonuclease [Sphingopyxis sp.]MCW0196818.1 very short patch repair endonuclease [Sphingopyxis sp.]
MTDHLSAERRSANMARIRSTDTKPELVVRRLLHGLGYRYRCHRRDLPGKPDLVFTSRRKIVFVHGCFWHQHPGCPRATRPKSSKSYWHQKLTRNVERDEVSRSQLEDEGWDVLTVWECETKRPDLKKRLQQFLGPTRYS